MSAQLKIFCKNIGEYIDINGGETLLEIAQTLKPRLGGIDPICAAVNNKTEPLQYQLFGPKQVEFLSRESASGMRVYTRSLCMMLYCAVKHNYPDMRLRIEHSIAGGYYCRLFPATPTATPPDRAEACRTLLGYMRGLQKRDVPFERKERLTADVIEKMRASGLPDKVQLLETTHELYTIFYLV